MRAFVVALVSLFVAPLYAASPAGAGVPLTSLANPEFKRIEHASPSLQRVRGLLRAGGVEASAVIDNVATWGVVIPAAGNAPGANGTYFRSDVTLVNMRDVDQTVALLWLPNGAPDDAVEFEGTIPAGWPFTYTDFVGSTLELTGVGALVIVPVNDAGELDEEGMIDAYSRIWSPSPNGGPGTFSQPFAGMDIFHLLDWQDALILGLRQDEGFRTNYGIVNMGEFDQQFYIFVVNNEGVTVAETDAVVRAGEMILRPLPAGNFGNISVLVAVDEVAAAGSLVWTTFASSTDNVTGDGWVSIPARVDREWIEIDR